MVGSFPTPAPQSGILKRLGLKLSDSSFITGTNSVSNLVNLLELLRSWWPWVGLHSVLK